MRYYRLRRQKMVSEINITPFTDVILVLLIIFMMATPFIFRSSIVMQLPQAITSQEPASRDINITISANGEVFLENAKYSVLFDANLFKFKLSALLKTTKDPYIVVNADKDVRYDFVIKVIDLASQAGFKHIVLGTELKK